MINSNFTKNVERLVNPVDVGTLHFIESFTKNIPRGMQSKMVEKSGEKTPYMGFVVEPYSYFLCYEIKDLEKAASFLPEGYQLIKTSIFENDEPKYYGIFGCFNAHTSGFWGMRVEFYLIAENIHTGLMSWIIVDYDTNTITYDPKNGFSDPNAKQSLITIDYNGELYIDVKNDDGRRLLVNSQIEKGQMLPLDKRLWIEGNLSIAYGGSKIEGEEGLFSLIFNPKEFEKALRIPNDAFTVEVNNWYPGLFMDEPSEVVCFPYAQHFLSDSPGHSSQLFNEEELVGKLNSVDFNEIKVFSTASFKNLFVVGGLISALTNTILIGLLLLT